MQNTGTMKPPGGMMRACLQLGKASAGAISSVAFTPSGKGKAVSVATCRTPSVTQDSLPGQPLSSKQVWLVVVLQCPVLWVWISAAEQQVFAGRLVVLVELAVLPVVFVVVVVAPVPGSSATAAR